MRREKNPKEIRISKPETNAFIAFPPSDFGFRNSFGFRFSDFGFRLGSRPTEAFSLIEVLAAILILGVAVLGLTEGITVALASSKDSELQTTAALYAAGRIETLRAEGDLVDGDQEGDCGQGLALYRWKQTIAGAGIDGLHEVDVVVEHVPTGKQLYELKTMLFQIPEDSTSGTANQSRDAKSKKKGRTGQ